MRGAGWIPAFAAGALFAAAIVLALVISSPAATPTALTPVRSDVAPDGATVGPEVAMARTGTSISPTSVSPEATQTSTTPPDSAMRTETAISSSTTANTTAAPVPVARGNEAVEQSVADGCRAKADEWQRRQADGEVDWSEFETQQRVTEDESVWLEPEPFDGRVWAVEERPYVPDFSSGLAVDTLASTDLAYAVEICEAADLLPEE